MYNYAVTKSLNGREVYVNLLASSAGVQINRQPYLLNLIKEVIETINLRGGEMSIERDMGRVIGNTDIVETSEKDTIIYAQPQKKNVFSRFVKNRSYAPSSKLTILLEKNEEGHYQIYDTWIGPCSPPFPGDERATAGSKVYWQSHALVMDSQFIQSKSITKVCPY